MNTPTARPNRYRLTATTPETLRLRAELPAVTTPLRFAQPTTATHDFLVSNPRPDLTADLHTLRMIEAG